MERRACAVTQSRTVMSTDREGVTGGQEPPGRGKDGHYYTCGVCYPGNHPPPQTASHACHFPFPCRTGHRLLDAPARVLSEDVRVMFSLGQGPRGGAAVLGLQGDT